VIGIQFVSRVAEAAASIIELVQCRARMSSAVGSSCSSTGAVRLRSGTVTASSACQVRHLVEQAAEVVEARPG
jgi:hypothetical protein